MNEDERNRYNLALEKSGKIRATLFSMTSSVRRELGIVGIRLIKHIFLALEISLMRGAVADGGVYNIEKECISGLCHGAVATLLNTKANELGAQIDHSFDEMTLCEMLCDADDDTAEEILNFCEEISREPLDEFITAFAKCDAKVGGKNLKEISEMASHIFFALSEMDGDRLSSSAPYDESNDAWKEWNVIEKCFKRLLVEPWKKVMEDSQNG